MWRCFSIIFLSLWTLPTAFVLFPKGKLVTLAYLNFWSRTFHIFNDLFLKWPVRTELNGSGDAAENYFAVIATAIIAAVMAMIWRDFGKVGRWLKTYLRWYLAGILLVYGFGKVFPPGQFEPLTSEKLLRPLGDYSPMGLFWAFMGASRPYAFFSGVLEVLAGSILLFPRFATIGALVSLGVMTNVFVLNLCYDVPVKLFSFQLVLVSLWIILLDRGRVISFALGNPVPAVQSKSVLSVGARTDRLVGALIFSWTLYGAVSFSFKHHEEAAKIERSFRLLDRGFHLINESPDID